jgi:Ca2+-transporting ATPase
MFKMPSNDFYRRSPEEIISELSTSQEKGLTSIEAKKRLAQYGNNELESKIKIPLWLLLLSQFKELFVIILIVGALISILIGSYKNGVIIFIIVIVNAIIGFIQEYKANKIIEKLKGLVKSSAKVIRDGVLVEVPQSELVPGDIIKLEEGDKVPADIRIIQCSDFKTNEFTLTGESLPQRKSIEIILEEVVIGDRKNMAYTGTTVASGNAIGVIVRTGMKTETGKIASLTEESTEVETPLQKELRLLARQLTIIAIIIAIGLFALGLLQEFSLYMSLVYALGVAMSVVPQALPAQVTVALTNGSNYLANRNAVVKSLPSVETLGSTTIICTDKTGTLTKNEMTVRSIWLNEEEYKISGLGYEPEGEIFDSEGKSIAKEKIEDIKKILRAASVASNAQIHPPDKEHNEWYPIGDPTEAALITAAAKIGIDCNEDNKAFPEIQEFSFTSERKRMGSIRKEESGHFLYVKGSVGSVLGISKYLYLDGKETPLKEDDISNIKKVNAIYAENSMRVLAIAYRPLEHKEDYLAEEAEKDVIFLGLIAMMDPPKEGVKQAVSDAKKAHIKIYILTGDHALTAEAIGKEIGLSEEEKTPVITGKELKELNDEKLVEFIKGKESIIFSRVDPEDKVRIVKILEGQGEIVAVTGDGVNDAPALKSAHIGVAMGLKGTDVTKEASDVVLLDDNFATLVDAVKGGRTIYNNLRKTIFATMTTNGGELVLVLLGLLAAALWDYPIPILAVQILAIDLLGEIMPLSFLTFDPPDPDIMTKPPRKTSEHIFHRISGIEVILLGTLIGALAFMNFFLFMGREGITLTMENIDSIFYFKATTLSYCTIVFCQFVNILQRRYEYISIFRNFFSNKLLLGSIAISIGLVMTVIYVPWIRDLLSFGSINILDWSYILISAGIYLIVFEILKVIKRLEYGKKLPSIVN